jgi:hypothetical protein
MLRAHHEGRADLRKPIWTLLVFELWRDHKLGAGRATEPVRTSLRVTA